LIIARKATQYLDRYAEAEARSIRLRPTAPSYDECLIIPAYAEAPELLTRLESLQHCADSILVILVLNQPDNCTDRDPNLALRAAIHALPLTTVQPGVGRLYSLFERIDVLLVERAEGLPAEQGVGLARKIGADIACGLKAANRLRGRWLHCTDADATLPTDYFSRCRNQHQEVSAVCHPFRHLHDLSRSSLAAQLYELRLHYYVLGLHSSGSPYAYHTLGSCISIDVAAYQQVRGFPRRAAAEDFYLLNKLAKVGPVAAGTGAPILLDARPSQRVPFGTGPAVAALESEANPLLKPLFYHPNSFLALAAILNAVPELYSSAEPMHLLRGALDDFAQAASVLAGLGAEQNLQHCQQHSANSASFSRHFHQWFDGFRTLKFIHGMRAAGHRDLTLAESLEQSRTIWPAGVNSSCTPLQLLQACANQQGCVD
jgi:hypothetical protein